MKTVLFFLLTCFSLVACCQKTGDDNFQLEFVTYANGHIVLAVQNKVDCTQDIHIKWAGQDTTVQLSNLQVGQIMLPAPGWPVSIQAKTVKSCNVQNNGGWFTISLSTLPIRDVVVSVKQPRTPPTSFAVYDLQGNERFHLQGTRRDMITRLRTLPRGVYLVSGTTVEKLANF